MYGEYDKLRAFNRYADFINNEFRKFTGIVNDAYLDTWLEELFLSSLHLKGRCIRGVNIESIIEGKFLINIFP